MRILATVWRWRWAAGFVLAAASSLSCDIDSSATYPAPPDPPRQYVEVVVQPAGAPFDQIAPFIEIQRLNREPVPGVASSWTQTPGRLVEGVPFGTYAVSVTHGELAGRGDFVVPPGPGTLRDTVRVSVVLGVRGWIRGTALLRDSTHHDGTGVSTFEAHYACCGGSTDASGNYFMRVAPGRWTVEFWPSWAQAPVETVTAIVPGFGDTVTLPTITLGH